MTLCNGRYRSGTGRYQNMYDVLRGVGEGSEQTYASVVNSLERLYSKALRSRSANPRRSTLATLQNYADFVAWHLTEHASDARHVLPDLGNKVVGTYVRANHAFHTGNARAVQRSMHEIVKMHNCALDVVLYGATRTWNRILRQVRQRGSGNARTAHAAALGPFLSYNE